MDTQALLGSVFVYETKIPNFKKLLPLAEISKLSQREEQVGNFLLGFEDIEELKGHYQQIADQALDPNHPVYKLLSLEYQYLKIRKKIRNNINVQELKKFVHKQSIKAQVPEISNIFEAELFLDSIFLQSLYNQYKKASKSLKPLIKLKLSYYLTNVKQRAGDQLELTQQLQEFEISDTADQVEAYKQESQYFHNQSYSMTDPDVRVLSFFYKIKYLTYNLDVLLKISDPELVKKLLINYDYSV